MSKNKSSIFLSIVPLIFIAGVKIYCDFDLNTCFGLLDGLRDVFLSFLIIILSLFFLFRQINFIIKKANFKTSRIIACLIVFFVSILALQGHNTWKELQLEECILKASIDSDQLGIYQINLMKNNKYYAQYGFLEWSCSHIGKYTIIGDTLNLESNINDKSESIIAYNYLITDSFLIPFNKLEKNQFEKLFIEN